MEHAGRDGLGEEIADFRGRVRELEAARALPAAQRVRALETALFELRYAADELMPRCQASGSGGSSGAGRERREEQLLRAVYQRLPLPVALLDREGTIRRLNQSAAHLVGVGSGYATGRPLADFMAPGDRAGLRSQLAATARGEGERSLLVTMLPGGPAQLTMVALRPPGETRNAVLAVFQAPGGPPAPRRRTAAAAPIRELAETARATLLLDLLDEAAASLLSARSAGPGQRLASLAEVLRGRIADWVIADQVTAAGELRRCAVAAPAGPEAAKLAAVLEGQDPVSCPLVAEAAGTGRTVVQVRPQDVTGFGRDEVGGAVIARAGVVSLMCLPVCAPVGDRPGPVRAVLTLFRTGTAGVTPYGAEPFSMPEAGVLARVARHAALAAGS